MSYVPLRKAVEILGLHPNTLRKYGDEGKIKMIKNEAGQRLYDAKSYIMGATRASTICYCRVSSAKQRDDLTRQVEFMQNHYPAAEVIKDIASGLNFKRKGLRAILDRILQGYKLKIIVASRDRLTRFGFDLIQYLVEQNGGEILVLDDTVQCPESEMVVDLLSIIQVFSCRIHGLRKYKEKIQEDSELPLL